MPRVAGIGAVLEGTGQPAGVVGVVLAGRRGQDQLHVPPAEAAVGGAHQRGNPGDLGGSRAGSAEAGRVAAEVVGCGDAGPGLGEVARGRAHPEVGARLGVRRALAEVVHRARCGHGVVIGVLVQGAVVAVVGTVAGREDVEDALAPEAAGDTGVHGPLPDVGSPVRKGVVRGAPAVVGDRSVAHVAGHGVGLVSVSLVQQVVVAVDLRLGRNPPNADVVVAAGRDDASHLGAVGFGRVVDIASARVVVISWPVDVGGQVGVVVLHPVVDHGHVDARSFGRRPRVLDVDVLSVGSLALTLVVEVPLAAVEGVVDVGVGVGQGDGLAPLDEVGVEDVL